MFKVLFKCSKLPCVCYEFDAKNYEANDLFIIYDIVIDLIIHNVKFLI